jgi:aminopeptidase N
LQEVGRRRLHSTCLDFLNCLGGKEVGLLAKRQFDTANCMTDKLASLGCLVNSQDCSEEKAEALEKFYSDAAGNALVLNKWFGIQALADYPGVIGEFLGGFFFYDRVRDIELHQTT